MSKIMKGGVEYAFGSSSIESGSSMEVITREEYDTLVANGTVKTGVYYFITEDNGTPEWVYDESTGKITGYKTKIGGADTVFPFKGGTLKRVALVTKSSTYKSTTFTYDVKADYPDLYANLTNDNFFMEVNSVPAPSDSQSNTGTTKKKSISYDASTGVLTYQIPHGSLNDFTDYAYNMFALCNVTIYMVYVG